jgi:iron complex transport system permease protein
MVATAHKESSEVKATGGRLTPRRLGVTLAVLLALVIMFAVVAISVGSERIGLLDILKILAGLSTGIDPGVSPEATKIIAQVRLPRILMGIIVGAALSVSGAAYQALLRNPLADPYILGVSTGAAVGAIAAIIFAESFPLGRPLAAFIGATLAIMFVYLLSQSGRQGSTDKLILAGIITNTFLSSVVIFLLTASGSRLQSAFTWLIGDLGGDRLLLPLVSIFVVVGIAIVYVNARSLNVIMNGEEEAYALGVEVKRVKAMVYIASSLMTGAAVAVSGVIGFVGLVIPHAVRLAGGSDNRLVVPASALAGALFLLVTDTLARTVVAPRELHIGVVTALVGAPIFIYLLRRAN